jgi:hypothetical protein
MRIFIVSAIMLGLLPASVMAKGGPAKPRSAASVECSRQADAKGLHGKARKKFRKHCVRDLRKRQH